MTASLQHRHANHRRTTRNLVAALVVLAAQALGDIQNPSATTSTDETRPAVVDPTGLGAALSITYDTDQTRPAVVDPTGLGAALSITYDTDAASR
jgi:hypothetical protein